MKLEEVLKVAGIEDKPFFEAGDILKIFSINRNTYQRWKTSGVIKTIPVGGKNMISRTVLVELCEGVQK